MCDKTSTEARSDTTLPISEQEVFEEGKENGEGGTQEPNEEVVEKAHRANKDKDGIGQVLTPIDPTQESSAGHLYYDYTVIV